MAAVGLTSYFMPVDGFLGGVILHSLFSFSCISILILWSHYFDYSKIPGLMKLTKYSAEIYLCQFMMLHVWQSFFEERGMKLGIGYIAIVLGSTLVISFPAHYVNGLISKGLKPLTKKG